MKTTVFATSVALGLALSGPAFAQTYTLNGTSVPDDQVSRIQAHCDTLMGSPGSTGTGSDAAISTSTSISGATTAPADTAGSAAIGSGTTVSGDVAASAGDAAATGAPAVGSGTSTGTETQSTSGTPPAGAAAGSTTTGLAGSNTAMGPGSTDFSTLDLGTVDLAACTAGGFTSAGTGSDTTTGAGASTTTTN